MQMFRPSIVKNKLNNKSSIFINNGNIYHLQEKLKLDNRYRIQSNFFHSTPAEKFTKNIFQTTVTPPSYYTINHPRILRSMYENTLNKMRRLITILAYTKNKISTGDLQSLLKIIDDDQHPTIQSAKIKSSSEIIKQYSQDELTKYSERFRDYFDRASMYGGYVYSHSISTGTDAEFFEKKIIVEVLKNNGFHIKKNVDSVNIFYLYDSPLIDHEPSSSELDNVAIISRLKIEKIINIRINQILDSIISKFEYHKWNGKNEDNYVETLAKNADRKLEDFDIVVFKSFDTDQISLIHVLRILNWVNFDDVHSIFTGDELASKLFSLSSYINVTADSNIFEKQPTTCDICPIVTTINIYESDVRVYIVRFTK